MKHTEKPVLTIGMIFKNEIRCLERCLKALQPLRDAVPCELIMADTGSDDGSREVAVKYADVLFDFPWIKDFAAARNAVMDRARGDWYLSVDCDEYLDEDCSQLVNYLSHPEGWRHNCCAVTIRNYSSYDFEGNYGDFLGTRMLKMSTGVRYTGAIHEAWPIENPNCYGLQATVFHHDGYVEFEKNKRQRNMELLEAELEKDPHDLKRLQQCIESCDDESTLTYIRTALVGLDEHWPNWELFGPSIMRHAISVAIKKNLPEFSSWLNKAITVFSNSIIIQLEVSYLVLYFYAQRQDYAKCIEWGERYLLALQNFRAKQFDPKELLFTTINNADPKKEHSALTLLANAYFHQGEHQKSSDTLLRIDGTQIDAVNAGNFLSSLFNNHTQSELDMHNRTCSFWEQIRQPKPSLAVANERITTVASIAERVFSSEHQRTEKENQFKKHAYTIFHALDDSCELGIAARMLETEDPQELEWLLSQVKDWNLLPIHALVHALKQDINFPVSPMPMDELDKLAIRVGLADKNLLLEFGRNVPVPDDLSDLNWARAILFAAINYCTWDNEDTDLDWALIHRFIALEEHLLSFCYTSDVLCEEGLLLLPPLHRSGWYCVRAFHALSQGDPAGYVAQLRMALCQYPPLKNLVQFLLDNTPQLKSSPSELEALADKVRVVLSSCAPDDPAVQSLKQSAAYQKVIHLIEGIDVSAPGNLLQ